MATKHFSKTSTGSRNPFGERVQEVEFTHALQRQQQQQQQQDLARDTSKATSQETHRERGSGGGDARVAEGEQCVERQKKVVSKMIDLELL
ncbi:hypothetical protein LSAT2_015083 [Lamellibrachia satsuma]|nr:hypothetical protein LSAT2_015083 [Lamellibrachia satsuma]